MNIEYINEAVEAVLGRQIDDTIWDRFARGSKWEYEIGELLAVRFEDAEPDIIETLAEIYAERPTSLPVDGATGVGGTNIHNDNERI